MPSLVALTDIAEALEINPRDLLEPDTDPVHIVQTPQPSNNTKAVPLISNLVLTSPASGSDLEVQRLVLQPNAPNLAFEPHPGEIFGYVLEGKLLLRIAEDAHELSPGDSYHFLATTPHGYEAGDPEGVKVLWVQSLKYETWRRVGKIRDPSGKPAKV